MAYYRECIICECTLDAGEGRICDECMSEIDVRAENRKNLMASVEEADGGQMVIGGLVNV